MPEWISRKTHFLAIRKDMSVVAIEKTADMYAKAVVTRKRKTKIRKEKQTIKNALTLEKAQRKASREEIKDMREDYKAKVESLRKEQKIHKEMLASKLKKARK